MKKARDRAPLRRTAAGLVSRVALRLRRRVVLWLALSLLAHTGIAVTSWFPAGKPIRVWSFDIVLRVPVRLDIEPVVTIRERFDSPRRLDLDIPAIDPG